MDFADSVKYLYSLGNEVSSMKLGLDSIRILINALGKPGFNYKKVQVAGTNGKGSVCAFLNAICISAGIKTGLYTSPHLISVTERIKIDGVDINENEFAGIASFVRETSELLVSRGSLESVPTYFEQLTAIALVAFANHGVDLAILETGLGGRLDATTAADAQFAAITPIDYDHQEYLGETLGEIAAEKAAIIHAGSKVVVAEQKPEALAQILGRCSVLGIEPLLTEDVGGNTSSCECVRRGADRAIGDRANSLPVVFPPIDFATKSGRFENVRLGLLGRHQIENAKVAILLAETLQDEFRITSGNIVEGLQTARHPGRLEYSGKYLFDGAHNTSGATALREYLDEFVDTPITLVFGLMQGKDINAIGETLFKKADNLILTQPENSRAVSPDEILEFVPQTLDKSSIFLTGNVQQALAKASEVSGEDVLIVVTGSLYLVGEARKILSQS